MRNGLVVMITLFTMVLGIAMDAYAKSGRVLVPFFVVEKGMSCLTAYPLLTNPNFKGEIHINKIVIYDRSDGSTMYTIKSEELEKATLGPMEAVNIFPREYKSHIPAIPGRPLYHALIYWEGQVTHPLVVKTIITSSFVGRVISQSVAEPYYAYPESEP
ncbi:MAG TPA: hypothetical protein EYP21_01850 [Syntrophaceae bacterium]|nr:hypothetical protein [Syntrophaceae bacterium]